MSNILIDIGEREIIRRILPRFANGIGDDCAIVNWGINDLVITTDPVPEPAAKLIGKDPDPYWMGWLLVIINASDLAAAGAKPVAFMAALEAPSDTKLYDFERFLLGIKDACNAECLNYIGGNLREGIKITGVGIAIGECEKGKALTRSGGVEGDLVVNIGKSGFFWRDVMLIKLGKKIKYKNTSPLFRPKSQLEAMRLLNKQGLIKAAIDNSDGLLPSISQIAEHNKLSVVLELNNFYPPKGITDISIDPVKLWLGWGDWNVIAIVEKSNFLKVRDICIEIGSDATIIGKLIKGPSNVWLTRDDSTILAPRLESERFSQDSWFSQGIEKYIELLTNIKLP